ncbi:MAG TPA: addiction module toxin RelE [Alphaproteobacteria bacterium]|nr:addiction module toxin RelE [Alphaproteobacteria bacterium]
MKIIISKLAERELIRMPSNRRHIIEGKIEQLASTGVRGDLAANIRPLRGSDHYQLRIGGDRVIFRLQNDLLIVDHIRPRGSAYR